MNKTEGNITPMPFTVFVLCFVFGLFGGLSSTLLPSYLSQITSDTFVKNADEPGAILNAIFIYGMLAGGILLGYFSDAFGRRTGILVSALLLSLFTLLTAFANTFLLLVVFRFLTGCGVGGILLTTTVLLAETLPFSKKAIALGILSICFPVGIFAAGILTYFVADWRTAFFVGLIPLFILIPAWLYIPESAWWLNEKNKIKSATIPKEKMDLLAILRGSIMYGAMLIGLWSIFAWLPNWVQAVANNPNDGQQKIGLSMMVIAASCIISGFFSGWLTKKISFKTLMLICFAGCFVFAVLLFRFTSQFNALVYVYIAGIGIFFGISQGVLNVYIPSLFTVSNRSASTGICFNISRLFTATVVFFIGWLLSSLGGINNALFIFSFVFLIGFVATLFSGNK